MELDGTVRGRFGKAGHGPKDFSSIHQMDCRNPNELYVAEITAFRVQKIILKPTQPPTAAQAGGASLFAQSVPEINYYAAADVISLPSFGEVAGVATNSKGHVFVYARTG